jgi:MFS family permease
VRKQTEPRAVGSPTWRPALVYANVVVGGASVMVVEILGTRVLRPFFGVSLFVWSALLAVTLASLAVGYFAGGVLVDRRPQRRVLYWLTLCAGVTCGLLPGLSAPVLSLADGVGIRMGALVSATLLFAPTLILLGMVSPAALRLLTRDVAAVGHTAGRVYGVSTLAGLAATFLTGFVLVPSFDVDTIFTGVSLLLILAGLTGLLTERVTGLAGLILLAPIAARFGAEPSVPGIRVIERSESPYVAVSVVQDVRRASPLRLLRVDHSFIGDEWVLTGESAVPFVHVL